MTILFAPAFPLYILAAFALAALFMLVVGLLHRARGTVLRALLFALLLLALADPSLIAEQREPVKDQALIVVDDSASMQIGDRASQATKTLDALNHKLAAFSDLETETIHVSGEDETDLYHAIDAQLATIPRDRLAGVIVLTDGEIHDQPQSAYTTPLHVLLAGQHDEFDRRLLIKQAPAYGIVGKKITLNLRVQDEPKPHDATAAVTFSRDDGSSQTMTLPVNQDMPLDVTVDHPGSNLFAFEAAEVPGELTTLNNSVAVSVNGIRDRLRVLLVSGEPHIGGRSWRDLLKADPAVDLIHFTILRSPMKLSPVPNDQMSLIAFPVKELFEDKLHSFDLVIFDRFSNRSLIPDPYLKNIAQYVQDGGSLLVSSATEEAMPQLSSSPLAEILPATPTGILLTGSFVPQVTPAGLRDPVTASLAAPGTQWGPWLRQIDAHADKGDVLMSGLNNAPLLILAHSGKGRVAEFLSDQFWLWARDYQGGGPQGELLRRVSHWLVNEPSLSETALHATAKRIDGQWQLAITRQSLRDDTMNAVVTGPDNQPLQVKLAAGAKPGVLEATMPVKSIGLYHIKDDQQEIIAWVGANDMPEFGAMRATNEIMAPVVKASNGSINWLADHPDGPAIHRTSASASQSGWGWIGLRQNEQYRVTGSKAYPLWPAWAALAVLLTVMMWAWRREGK